MVAHFAGGEGVGGSNPLVPTIKFPITKPRFCGALLFLYVALEVLLSGSEDRDSEQSDMLDHVNVIADGEHMSRSEAEDAQALGQLYDTFY